MSYSEKLIQKVKEMYILDHKARVHIDKTQHSINVFFSDMKFKLRIVEEKTDEINIRINEAVPGVFAQIMIKQTVLSFERTPNGTILVQLKDEGEVGELDTLGWDGGRVASERYDKEFTIPLLNSYLKEAFDQILF
ncbi:hypothetical protein M1K46_18675 [Fictibacillus sp. WQ 8-8]|uniref:Uncharacterized protein n=1 Tax=Fictibacillus marinisediminis TaxID=2878389 RepID=A0A9X1XBA3_9BACL|nr:MULTISPECIES: hypothetical protein [Fictibacillus]SFF03966.1 hypothetical protein SAMN05428981_11345 [Bacillus sp. OV194]MCK6256223.1 hypothetical protein [Fictibacillus marinisediminis]MCQ6267661.1 hypothetical protein [Fictibacillus sp. WQ 8-8]MED2971695.1 hypothetical protein [Fictibacillus sp. B-59209]UZJ77875.1 hypothetical protein OKX00_17165 [Fictibacillus sp. KU28468]